MVRGHPGDPDSTSGCEDGSSEVQQATEEG
jgi:hypothetical protein